MGGMNSQLFIVLVWAHIEHEDGFSEVIHLGETPIFGNNQEVVLEPAIEELRDLYNVSNPEQLPEDTKFFATIKTSYRGMYFDATNNNSGGG